MILPDFKPGEAVKGAFWALFPLLFVLKWGHRTRGFIDVSQPWFAVIAASAAFVGAFVGGFYYEDLHDVDLGRSFAEWYVKRRA